MPPKRIIKNNAPKSKPPTLVRPNNDQENSESTEAELKFDQEVLWCISQFEKILSTGKLPESKRLESIKAMNTLRKPSVSKIQKVQLMRQYFKDVRAKMSKDEESIKSQAQINFMVAAESEVNKGVFLKKKQNPASEETSKAFLFNFKDPSIEEVSSQIDAIKLS